PCHRDVKADLWQIWVPIRVSLPSYLQQSNHWHKHAEVPQPTSHEVRSFPSKDKRYCGDSNKNHQSQTHFPYGQSVFRVRVEDSKICLPEHLPNVDNIGNEGVSYSFRHRQLLSPTDCPSLTQERDDAGSGKKRNHWNFFQNDIQ